MKLSDLEGKRILILGYAREGKTSERFLREKFPNADIRIASKDLSENYLDAQKDADIAIKTAGIAKNKVTIPFTTCTDLFFEEMERRGLRERIIGVTGSKGKSTTVSLIAAILRQAGHRVHLIGNIGAPALDVFQEELLPTDYFVLELSSYQLETCEFSPHIAVFTSLFQEHLDYHGGFESYLEAKSQIVRHQAPGDWYVYNEHYPQLKSLSSLTPAQSIPFDAEAPVKIEELKLRGEHNLENIRGALTVARLCDVSMEDAIAAVRSFEPLKHRLTDVGVYRGIRFVDDAISTAPESTMFAVQTLGDVETLFLGGEDRGLDFSGLARFVKEQGIKNVVLFPTTGQRIKQELERIEGSGPLLFETTSMEEAVRFAYEHTSPGKTCLLSTASPSFTLWKNFEEKGDLFIQCVRELAKDDRQ